MTEEDKGANPAFHLCLEEIREESQYIGERLERVYVLQNTAILLTGGIGAIISLMVALGKPEGATLSGIRPYIWMLLAAPWVLVPTALMVLRNHFYIDIAERYMAETLQGRMDNLLGPATLPLRVHFTRKAILFQDLWTRLFMSFVALAEYAIPFSMSTAFMLGFYLLALQSGEIEWYEWSGLGLDAALLSFLMLSVFVGRWIRPHEVVFGKPVKTGTEPARRIGS